MITHCLFTILLCFSLFKKGQSRRLFQIAFLLLYIFAALRFEFGNDYNSYKFIYNSIIEKKAEYSETLYYFINSIMPDFKLLIAFTSIFFVLIVYYLIDKNVEFPFAWFSLFIFIINPYIYLISLSAIRQTLATVLFIIAVYFSYKKKILIYLLLIILSVFMHKSALMLLPFFVIANTRKVTKFELGAFVSVVLVFTVFDSVLYDFMNLAIQKLNLKRYEYYFTNASKNSLRATLLTSLYFIYIVYNLPNLRGKAVMYSKLYLFAISFGIIAYNFSMLTRLQMYFDVFSVVSIPMIASANLNPRKARIKNLEQVLSEENKSFKKISSAMIDVLDIKVCSNKYIKIFNNLMLPMILVLIYVLRYVSFFTNPLWSRFFDYKTIFSSF